MNSASCRGLVGFSVETSWKPRECQVTSSRFCVSVGLCALWLDRFSWSGGTLSQ
jgi:hypothetical protein